jgi:hypothetical protein
LLLPIILHVDACGKGKSKRNNVEPLSFPENLSPLASHSDREANEDSSEEEHKFADLPDLEDDCSDNDAFDNSDDTLDNPPPLVPQYDGYHATGELCPLVEAGNPQDDTQQQTNPLITTHHQSYFAKTIRNLLEDRDFQNSIHFPFPIAEAPPGLSGPDTRDWYQQVPHPARYGHRIKKFHDLLELEPLLLMYGPLRPATHNHGILESNLFIKAPAREIMVCNPNQYTD